MNPKVSLVILNRNDLEGARVVVPKINRALFHEIFVVDGISTDGSVDYFRSQGLTTYVQNEGGRGGAFRYAMQKATGDYLIYLSTDGEEDPADLPKFIEAFKQGGDLVIASRLAKGAHHKAQERWAWIHRLLYLKVITWMINFMFGTRLTDCWNGYRGFKLASLKAVKTDAEAYLLEAQQTIRFQKQGMKIVEFPTHEGQRIGGHSGNPIFRTGWAHIVLLFREKFGAPKNA